MTTRPTSAPALSLSEAAVPALGALAARWRLRAEELEPYAPAAAEAFRRAAAELEAARAAEMDQILTLDEGAREAGVSADHLRHLVSAGRVPNAGRKGAPRVRRGDLLALRRRPRDAGTTYDPSADALAIVQRAAGDRP